MEKKLETIFKKIFPKFKGKFNDKISPKNFSDWDSLSHLNLITNVSKKFKINFDFNEILQINKIGDLKRIIKKKNV
jgi:acyl carrier protein|tara:strand:- start:66 stop:293 length:228 start_codon:yes stop_codon:yes gene_type:complete